MMMLNTYICTYIVDYICELHINNNLKKLSFLKCEYNIHGMYAPFIHQCIHSIHSANKLETKHELLDISFYCIHIYLSWLW